MAMSNPEIEYNPQEELRPALGVTRSKGEFAYVVITLPTRLNGEVEPRPWMIRSDRKTIAWAADKLAEEGYAAKLRSKDHVALVNRWPIQDLKKFLDGDNNNNNQSQKVHNLFIRIRDLIKEFMEFPEESHYDLMAVWIICTYFHQLTRSFPFLYFGGIKRSGKTKGLYFIRQLAFNAIVSVSISSSSMFRICQGLAATLLMDETGYLSNKQRHEDIRELLYARYKQGQVALRTEKDTSGQFVTSAYEVYGPTAAASIEGLEDVMEDRAIPVIMKRTLNRAIANAEIREEDSVFAQLRAWLYRLYLEGWKDFEVRYNRLGEVSEQNEQVNNLAKGISGRAFELWKPLFALALWIDEDSQASSDGMFTSALSSLTSLAGRVEDQRKVEDAMETADGILVSALVTLVTESGYYSTKTIKDKFLDLYGEKPDWANAQWVGRAMKRLSLNTERRRMGQGYEYRLTPERIRDTALRMGIDEAALPQIAKAEGICVVCGKMTDEFVVRKEEGECFLHQACSDQWMGKL